MTQQHIYTNAYLNNNDGEQQTKSPVSAIPSKASDGQNAVHLLPMLRVKNGLPAFLNKLYSMINSPETDPWVHWNDNGESFIIPNSQALAEQVLGHHFKHNNFASFVRQLNMYGFHKIPHLNHGVLHNDGLPEVWEFTNENFQRDEPWRMRYIIRKKGEAEKAKAAAKAQQRQEQQVQSSSPIPSPQPHLSDPADVAIARAEIQTVATRQNMVREEVVRLAESNENLWKYTLETRRRYQEQQIKLERLIKFLSEAFRTRVSEYGITQSSAGTIGGTLDRRIVKRKSYPSPYELGAGTVGSHEDDCERQGSCRITGGISTVSRKHRSNAYGPSISAHVDVASFIRTVEFADHAAGCE